jgi:molecular chaperone HscC
MIVGIDLGTTNSLIAVWKDGKPQLIPNALGQVLTPSVIGLDDNGEILVGQPALERMLIHPELTASVFKRYMGTGRSIWTLPSDTRAQHRRPCQSSPNGKHSS